MFTRRKVFETTGVNYDRRAMPDIVARLSALVLGGSLLWAAAAKAVFRVEWSSALSGYRLSAGTERVARIGVPAGELTAGFLLAGVNAKAGAAVSLAMLSGFCLAIARARSLWGDRLPCGCWGRTSTRDYRTLLARNASLGVLAALVVSSGLEGGALAGLHAPEQFELLPAALAIAGVGLVGWMAYATKVAFRGEERQ